MTLNSLSRPLLLALALCAVTATAAPPRVDCRVIQFARNPGMPAALYAPTGRSGPLTKVTPSLSVETLPVEISIPRSGLIKFRAEDNPQTPVVAVATMPATARDVFIFLLEDDNPDDAILYKPVVIPNPLKERQPGGATFHNASADECRVVLGQSSLPLPPGKTIRLPTPADRDEYNMVPLKVEAKKDDEWVAIKDGPTRFSSRDYYLMFAYPDSRRGSTQFKSYRKNIEIPVDED